jgi:hypothetical protein
VVCCGQQCCRQMFLRHPSCCGGSSQAGRQSDMMHNRRCQVIVIVSVIPDEVLEMAPAVVLCLCTIGLQACLQTLAIHKLAVTNYLVTPARVHQWPHAYASPS